jgi:hypothetical protein
MFDDKDPASHQPAHKRTTNNQPIIYFKGLAQVHKHLSPQHQRKAPVARTGAPVVKVTYPVDSEVNPAVEPVATRASVAPSFLFFISTRRLEHRHRR